MRFFQSLVAATASLTAVTSAAALVPAVADDSAEIQSSVFIPRGRQQCLRESDANELVDAYVRMITLWNDADAKYLAETFSDWSDSINILAGFPRGGPTFPSKAAFVGKQQVDVSSQCVLCRR